MIKILCLSFPLALIAVTFTLGFNHVLLSVVLFGGCFLAGHLFGTLGE